MRARVFGLLGVGLVVVAIGWVVVETQVRGHAVPMREMPWPALVTLAGLWAGVRARHPDATRVEVAGRVARAYGLGAVGTLLMFLLMVWVLEPLGVPASEVLWALAYPPAWLEILVLWPTALVELLGCAVGAVPCDLTPPTT